MVSGAMARHVLNPALLAGAGLLADWAHGSPHEAATPVQAVPASAHLLAAQRQARRDPSLQALFQRTCLLAGHRIDAPRALQMLQSAEADWRLERDRPEPREAVLRQVVVARSCAAHQLTRLSPGSSHAVWLHTQVEILGVLPSAAGWTVEARATTMDGPVVGSRITIARGLHHTCFALTDAAGSVRCTLVDTHPHSGRPSAWAEAHEGPIVATVAGQVTPARVELPAVGQREIPVFMAAGPFR
jgi:hypothetical protein